MQVGLSIGGMTVTALRKVIREHLKSQVAVAHAVGI
jgi:hypothetical protein